MALTPEQEDAIIAQAREIERAAYLKAEKEWEETPSSERKRPWPRCNSLTCNRTGVCLSHSGGACQGFDF